MTKYISKNKDKLDKVILTENTKEKVINIINKDEFLKIYIITYVCKNKNISNCLNITSIKQPLFLIFIINIYYYFDIKKYIDN